MARKTVRTATGRNLDDLNMEAVRAGALTAEDFRISGETLRHQAKTAEAAGYRQLAENLRRGAELTSISNEEVFDIYDALRPGRSAHDELMALADRLEKDLAAPLTAAFVREAAEVYQERGLLRDSDASTTRATGAARGNPRGQAPCSDEARPQA
jgi:propanediol dehydratase small subunit